MMDDTNNRVYANACAKQREYFLSGATLSFEFRLQQLRRLYNAVKKYEERFLAALREDLGKSGFESYATEISVVYNEITHTLNHLKVWMRDQKVPTTLMSFGARSRIHYQPLGVVLIMAPWNYPFQLTIAPLAAAVAAGNCVVLKPSRYSANTSQVLAEMINEHFSREYIAVFQGGRDVNTGLLKVKFDHIFFTGSAKVGKIVMEAAAKSLTPVTLELGGKCPCIVDKTADIHKTAQRIIWGKGINAGQTCVAPDYILVHSAVRDKLIACMKQAIDKFFPRGSGDFCRIIHERAFDRLVSLLENERIIAGGSCDRGQLKIE